MNRFDIRKFMVVLLLTAASIVHGQELSWEVEQTWGYTQEILTVTLLAPQTANRTVHSLGLSSLPQGVEILEQKDKILSRVDPSTRERLNYSAAIIRFITNQPGIVELTGEAVYTDGSSETSSPQEFTIESLPYQREQNLVRVRPFSQSYMEGLPGDVVVEAFLWNSWCEREDILPFITLDGATAVTHSLERWLWIDGEEHYLFTQPLSLIVPQPGEYRLMDSTVEIQSPRGGEASGPQVLPVEQDPIQIREDNFQDEVFARCNTLELSTLFFPREIKEDQEQHFFIYAKTDGLLFTESLTSHFSLPQDWQERFNGVSTKWVDDHTVRSYQFVYFGTFERNGHRFGSIEQQYATPQGEIHRIQLELGRVSQESSAWPGMLSFFLTIIAVLGIVYLILKQLQRIRIKQKKPADLPLKEIDSGKLGAFSKQYELTRREQEILEVLVHGKSTKEISADLFISPETTKKHIKNIMKKTQASTRLEILVKLSNFQSGS